MYGSDVLAALGKVNGNGPCAIIVRHAARHPIVDIRRSLEVGLTDEGMNDARRFGSTVGAFSCVRLFHSPALRCQQTAEHMMRGLEGNGASVSITGPERNLCAPYMKDESCLARAAQVGKGFIREWFEGQLDEEWILDTAAAADMVMAPIVERLQEPGGEGRLDIHVSHDWEISLLREELFGLRHEDVGWPPFLDGILFRADGGKIKVMYNSHETSFKMVNGRRSQASMDNP
ncbi:hypothetical protein AOA80_10080 [Methanomassiliicoccales archaeon RumEn M1]|jgi:broad specificity phosphatase PhoE|nr:hypothetical protein AOA80_10080 [Methanomassiliicoccales archaeon RumEn M1]